MQDPGGWTDSIEENTQRAADAGTSWWVVAVLYQLCPFLSSFEVPGALGGSRHAYLGLDSQYDLGQGHDEALESDGDVLQHKVGDSHDPQQVKEVQGLQVGLQEYEAGECSKNQVTHLDLVLGSFLSLRNLANVTNRKYPDLGITLLWSASPSATDLLCDFRKDSQPL